MIVSGEILFEYEEVLQEHAALGSDGVVLQIFAESPDVLYKQVYYQWNAVTIDPDDNKFFDAAVAAGGLMATKPYISGSNYLCKMGTWKKGPWQEVWDALLWRLLHVHRGFFAQNPRLGILLNAFDKMPKAKQEEHLSVANIHLKSIDESGR